MTNAFDDYISKLEGQSEINPLIVTRDLHQIYEHDVTTRDAKIAAQNDLIAARDQELISAQAEISKWKTMNFDLTLQLPVNHGNAPRPSEDETKPPGMTTLDDLFA